ncbi:hypothetical protein [Niallia sp.]|uniref:hypothetical protein n=1 Tax=Niallia sp. TaxID=2837523 RepID=UPI002896891C|nr:hypothetical protein [Niallia sp.]
MENTYTKEKLLIMLEEIQEELDSLDETLLKSKNQNMQLIQEHITSLNEIEKGMTTFEKKISTGQMDVSSGVSPYARQLPLYLNLAK